MKKPYIYLFLVALSLTLATALSGCNPFKGAGCAIQTTVVKTTSAGVSAGLQCANPAAVEATFTEAAAKLNLCPTDGVKSVGGDICAGLSSTLIGSVLNGAIPAAWDCSANLAQDQLQLLIVKACAKAFP